MNTITLKPGKEKSLLRRHPWVYATGVDTVEGRCESGSTVIVRAADGRFLARTITVLPDSQRPSTVSTPVA